MKYFDLTGKTALITGAAGLLGMKHAEAILEAGGNVILTDINPTDVIVKADELRKKKYGTGKIHGITMDVTKKEQIQKVANAFETIDILINNAALDPKVKKETTASSIQQETRFETMTFEYWLNGIDAIMNGTFLCSQVIGNKMLKQKQGNIINIASDLSVIAPDQRIYRKQGIKEDQQPVKPITYSAAKYAVLGMTKYLAAYFADKNIRVNCLSPTGVFNDHPKEFEQKLSNIIPMGRMADINEYKGAIVFLCSNASSYMTGHNLVIDGGKTIW